MLARGFAGTAASVASPLTARTSSTSVCEDTVEPSGVRGGLAGEGIASVDERRTRLGRRRPDATVHGGSHEESNTAVILARVGGATKVEAENSACKGEAMCGWLWLNVVV